MALVKEDGTGKTDSNTYALEVLFSEWLSDRGYTLKGVLSTSNLILQATDYLETLSYIGSKNTQSQALQWPRSDAFFDGFDFPVDEIPKQLIDAQMMTAYQIDLGFNPMATVDRAVKKKKVDVIEIEYMDDADSSAVIKSVNSTLSKLLANSGASFTANVSE